MVLSSEAESLILGFEGWDKPWVWPGHSSGITIPIGYDLGYEPFTEDWEGLLDQDDFRRLKQVQGLKGSAAAAVAPHMRGIIIPHDAAIKVFRAVTIPRYASLTAKTFPQSDKLPRNTFGALLDLVYNRGSDLSGARRIEMSVIRDICVAKVPGKIDEARQLISKEILKMRRLWENTPSDRDLYDRRTQEALLVWPSLKSSLPMP